MKRGYLIIIIIIIASIIATIYLVNRESKNTEELLFKSEYINDSWGYQNYGYVIYSNGKIQQFNNSTNAKDQNLKKAKLTKEELKRLIELSSNVIDNLEVEEDKSSSNFFDIGTSKTQVYNQKLGEWIILNQSDSQRTIKNNTDVAKEIMELTSQLKSKYLN